MWIDAGRSVGDASWIVPLAACLCQELNQPASESAHCAKVLVIEAAGTASGVASSLGIDCPSGLAEILRGDDDWATTVQATPHPQIDLLAAGRAPLPADCLEQLDVLWQEFKQCYRAILIVAGPWRKPEDLGKGLEPLSFVSLADAAILCIELDGTSQSVAKSTKRQLQQLGLPILGCVVLCRKIRSIDIRNLRFGELESADSFPLPSATSSMSSEAILNSSAAAATDNSSKAGRLLVMSATYNEIENVPKLVDEVLAAAPDADLLIIDDNSPDGTGTWCDKRAQGEPRLSCMHRSGKLGLGTAIVQGMQYAIEKGYSYAINIDADFSHDPKQIPDLLAAMNPPGGEPRDVVIGSRYIPGGTSTGWPLKRRIMSRCVNLYSRWMLWLPANDVSGGFRCYRVSMLEKLDFSQMRSSGYSFQEEILWMLRCCRARFGEIPINFAERECGVSKINMREAFTAMRIILQLGLQSLVGK